MPTVTHVSVRDMFWLFTLLAVITTWLWGGGSLCNVHMLCCCARNVCILTSSSFLTRSGTVCRPLGVISLTSSSTVMLLKPRSFTTLKRKHSINQSTIVQCSSPAEPTVIWIEPGIKFLIGLSSASSIYFSNKKKFIISFHLYTALHETFEDNDEFYFLTKLFWFRRHSAVAI